MTWIQEWGTGRPYQSGGRARMRPVAHVNLHRWWRAPRGVLVVRRGRYVSAVTRTSHYAKIAPSKTIICSGFWFFFRFLLLFCFDLTPSGRMSQDSFSRCSCFATRNPNLNPNQEGWKQRDRERNREISTFLSVVWQHVVQTETLTAILWINRMESEEMSEA